MAITSHQINLTVQNYLVRYPNERANIKPLLDAIEAESNLTARTNFEGHVTCGAVLLGINGHILHVHHRALDRWLLPGGHIENTDLTLHDAALRELNEETGISSSAVTIIESFGAGPIDIDVHRIPENRSKCEPSHWHFDIRYMFRTNAKSVVLQADEVKGHKWLPPTEIPSTSIAQKLAKL